MKNNTLCWMNAADRAGAIKRKKVSPIEVVDGVLASCSCRRRSRAGGAVTPAFNLTGQPAATVPCGFTSDGLPIALQIVGRRFDDVTVPRASTAFEAARRWADRRPR